MAIDGGEQEMSILTLINSLFNIIPPRDMPSGLHNFRIMQELVKAYEKAHDTGVLVLEEREYEFVRSLFERHVPASWAADEKVAQAITSFMEAKKK